jgi:DNA repair exonuclease SbcCD nuclease subunit
LIDWIYETAMNKEADTIIFTGDIFHETKPDSNLISLFLSFLKDCKAVNIKVFIVIGNHDIKRIGKKTESILKILEAF